MTSCGCVTASVLCEAISYKVDRIIALMRKERVYDLWARLLNANERDNEIVNINGDCFL